MIHYLDDLRHFLAFTWSIWTWVGNISAGIVVAAVASIFWPPIRRRVHAFMDAKLGDVHAKLDSLHAKTDAIIQHHGIQIEDGKPSGEVLEPRSED